MGIILSPTETLNKYFGYNKFRPGQQEIVDEIINGKNVLAILPTGAGKSICYQIPALISDNYSIVISPLIALMKDQVDALNKRYEIAAFINSTQSFGETEKVLADIAHGKIKLVYVAPERLENIEFALRLKNLSPKFLFIDEAHCISEWGHNFRPSYTKLKQFIEYTGIKNISAFTATATPEVVNDIIKQLGLKNVQLIVKGFERNNLYINVEITKQKKEKCLQLLQQHQTPAIIYASSRKSTEQITEFLKMNKFNCNYYHAGLDPIIRKKIQEEFIENKLPIIVATNAFGMGIDKQDIRLVIHFNLPGSIENYYQEIGRAGRDGRDAFTYLLFEENDKRIHDFFISNSYPTKELIKNIYNALCDSAQIAVGNKSDRDIQVDKRYIQLYLKEDINSSLIHSSIKYLEDAGYLRINSALQSKNKIKILFESSRLKNFIKHTTNELIKTLLLYLIRNFGSDIFLNFKILDLNNIQIDTGLTNDEISDTLTNLEFLGIIEFKKAETKETISLMQPRVKADDLKLNYKLINEFYISAKQKLDQISDFVYTNECRFKFILNYFGEKADNYKCGKCDICLKSSQPAVVGIDFVKEKILDLLNEAGSSLSEKEIQDILLGKKVITNYRTLISYSSLKGYSKSDISLSLKSLDYEKKMLTTKKDKKKTYKIDLKKAEPDLIINESKKEEEVEKINLDYDYNLELFHKLRLIRDDASKKFLQSPNIICPDSLLSKISQLKPKTKNELLSIPGFNERMFNKIGNEILEIIKSFEANPAAFKNISQEKLPPNVLDTFKYLQQGYSLSEIARIRKLTEAVISMQLETIISYFPGVDVSSLISDNNLNLIKKEVEKGLGSLKELKERLPKEISYPIIRIALAKIKASH